LRGRASGSSGPGDTHTAPQDSGSPGFVGSARSFADVNLFGHAADFSSFAARINEQPAETAITGEEVSSAAADSPAVVAPEVPAGGIPDDIFAGSIPALGENGKRPFAPREALFVAGVTRPGAMMSASGIVPRQGLAPPKNGRTRPAAIVTTHSRAARLREALISRLSLFNVAVSVRAGGAAVVMRVAGLVRAGEAAAAVQHALRSLGIGLKSLRLNGRDWLGGEEQ
jgi:hypothetical protein